MIISRKRTLEYAKSLVAARQSRAETPSQGPSLRPPPLRSKVIHAEGLRLCHLSWQLTGSGSDCIPFIIGIKKTFFFWKNQDQHKGRLLTLNDRYQLNEQRLPNKKATSVHGAKTLLSQFDPENGIHQWHKHAAVTMAMRSGAPEVLSSCPCFLSTKESCLGLMHLNLKSWGVLRFSQEEESQRQKRPQHF